ncbi:MAG: sensor histidine kinase [Acidobacteriaceae bacterium]|nr:sensor histidine kinase [Acidobacteriaceae bacterium]
MATAMGYDLMNPKNSNEMDVLVLAPFGKDAALIENVLRESNLRVRIAKNFKDVVEAVREAAGAAIVAEEALHPAAITELAQELQQQPTWSDFPLLVLTGGGLSTADTEVAVRARAPLGNVTLLERPLRPATLISVVRSAVAGRRRQYEIRNHLHEREIAEEALRSARDALESVVEERTLALRRLSARLIRLQDDERRRFARELHDSLGQYLAAAKITLDMFNMKKANGSAALAEAQELIDRAISETRTLSHLLHPPLLDTAGFASAATWYVEGFGKRSGIETSLEIPENLNRLPENVETALFRIMQESLTNVYRHSGSSEVKVKLTEENGIAILMIEDSGHGIPQDVLDHFSRSGTNVGVGLAGIRERIKELGGNLEIASNAAGTRLTARVPIVEARPNALSSDSQSQMYSSFAL